MPNSYTGFAGFVVFFYYYPSWVMLKLKENKDLCQSVFHKLIKNIKY